MRGGPVSEDAAQATVEAAFLMPAFLVLLLLCLQPVCLLYTRAVMEAVAAGTARLMVTAEADEASCRAFALRGLAAVPDVGIFHAGGPLNWDVEFSYGRDAAGAVEVRVAGPVRPLPVLGAFARVVGEVDGRGNVVLESVVSYEGRPEWLVGDYEEWTAAWE